MKRTVWVFGLIAGITAALLMSASIAVQKKTESDYGMVVGYTILVASLLIVFVGVKSYRDNVLGGEISFGRALGVGVLISLIASVCYAVTWEIVYFSFMPDCMDRYFAQMQEKVQASGLGVAEVQAKLTEINRQKDMMKNPLVNGAMAFIEPFPVALLISVIAALVLQRKPGGGATAEEVSA